MPGPTFEELQHQRIREVMEEQRQQHLREMVSDSRAAEEMQRMRQEMQNGIPEQVANMEAGEGVQIEHPALPQEQETRRERKKREEREKASKKAERQARLVGQKEVELLRQREHLLQGGEMGRLERRREEILLDEKFRAIQLIEESKLLDAGDDASEEEKLQIRWEGEVERVKAISDFARMLPIDSKEREQAMRRKEEQELKADKLRKQLKVMQIIDRDERTREESTLSRHAKYDFLKGIFRSDNPLSHEDAVCTVTRTADNGGLVVSKRLVNVGRAFFGGTKPMYTFEDREAPIYDAQENIIGYEEYLFKEAVNCVGFYKPEGALVTEAAAKLQDKICGPYSIPAFAVVRDGKVLGSFQKKIESTDEPHVDLFQWQANPQQYDPLSADMTNEILREHTLDWLLCNFDTKGENFLHRTDGHLCSFDKEASFSKLKDADAAHMSTTYKPHANDTLYNTIFTEFAEGRQMLDLSTSITQIEKAEEIPDEEYLQMFNKMLTQKYGERSAGNTKRAEAEQAILVRKTGLREEYRRFYTELIQRRKEALRLAGREDDTAGMLDAEGRFKFPGEGMELLIDGTKQEDLLVEGTTEEQLLQHGGTTYNLTLPKARADRIVAGSNGFLTARKNEDDSYTLRPSMPEKVTFAGREIEFRKNYKRFTKAMAMIAVTVDGVLKENTVSAFNDANAAITDYQQYNRQQIESAEEAFTRVFLPMFQEDESLHRGQTAEEAFAEFLEFMRYARGRVGNNIVSIFGTEWMNSLQDISIFPARLDEAERNGTIAEADLRAFRADLERTKDTLTRCAQQDMDSEEVFLLGACSANARLVTAVFNPAENLRQDTPVGELRQEPFNYYAETIMDYAPQDELRIRMDALREVPMTDEEWQDLRADAMRWDRQQGVLSYTTYEYHTSGHIGELDGVHVTLEAFAPEGHQLIGPGLTDEVGIGLFHTGEDFRAFYGRDLNSINTPEKQRRTEAKRQITGGNE